MQISIAIEVGAPIQISDCTGSDQQQFVFGNNDFTLRLKNNQNLCLDVGSKASCDVDPFKSYAYCDPTKDKDTRIKDLLNRLQLNDKVPVNKYA